MAKKSNSWTSLTKNYKQNGGTFQRSYPQQNSYKGGAKKHEHKWYNPGSQRSGWTGSNVPRKKR